MRICKHFFYLYYFSFFFSLGDVFLNLYEFFWIWNLEGGREEGKEGRREVGGGREGGEISEDSLQ